MRIQNDEVITGFPPNGEKGTTKVDYSQNPNELGLAADAIRARIERFEVSLVSGV